MGVVGWLQGKGCLRGCFGFFLGWLGKKGWEKRGRWVASYRGALESFHKGKRRRERKQSTWKSKEAGVLLD